MNTNSIVGNEEKDTMMVEAVHTVVTDGAVRGARRPIQVTGVTVLHL